MKYQTVKLDNRHSHRNEYAYMIEFSKIHWAGTGVLAFDRARRWFVDNYGWSQDTDTQETMIENFRRHPESYLPTDINPVWAYSVKYMDYRIYVATERELAWFVLCHTRS